VPCVAGAGVAVDGVDGVAGACVAGAAAPGFTLIVPVGVCARTSTNPTGLKLSSAAATNETTPQELGLVCLTPQDLVVEPGVT
jgi:hypothetical protein